MKKSSKTEMLFAVVTLSLIGMAPSLLAEADTNRAESTARSARENTAEAGRDIGKESRKIGRKAQDKACPMVNGKIDCAAQRMKNDAKNTGDEIKDKAHEPRKD